MIKTRRKTFSRRHFLTYVHHTLTCRPTFSPNFVPSSIFAGRFPRKINSTSRRKKARRRALCYQSRKRHLKLRRSLWRIAPRTHAHACTCVPRTTWHHLMYRASPRISLVNWTLLPAVIISRKRIMRFELSKRGRCRVTQSDEFRFIILPFLSLLSPSRSAPRVDKHNDLTACRIVPRLRR